MTTKIVAIDPGMSTGIVFAEYTQSDGPVILSVEQIEGGLRTLSRDVGLLAEVAGCDEVICERFKTRPMARSYQLEELEPLRIEGYLMGYLDGISAITWREPEARKLTSGQLSENRRVLQSMGLWTLPSEVGCADANDANAAMAHLIGYLRDIRHLPTLSRLEEAEWPPEESGVIEPQ